MAGVGIPDKPSRQKPEEIIFATLRTGNDPGQLCMNDLGDCYDCLSDHHRKFLRVTRGATISEPVEDSIEDSDSDTDFVEIHPRRTWNGEWDLSFERMINEKKTSTLTLKIGKGKSNLGPDRGVDILTALPGTPSRGVRNVHAIFEFHQQSGYLMLNGVNNNDRVRYLLDNKIKELGTGESHMMWQPANIFYIGNVKLILEYAELDAVELEELRRVRDQVFKKAGIPLPDPRLPVLPHQAPLRRLESVITFAEFDSGGFGTVGVGADISTGEPCAVKTIQITKAKVLEEILNELEVSLQFAEKDGLLQAWRVCCNHYKTFNSSNHQHLRDAFSRCSLPDHIHIIMALAIGNFSSINNNPYTLEALMRILFGILLGIAALHAAGYMHRDVTVRNMLLIPGPETTGVLCDYGKAVQKQWATSEHIGPAYSRAPEVTGKSRYTNKIDIYSCGLAFAKIWIVKAFGQDAIEDQHGRKHMTQPEMIGHLRAMRYYRAQFPQIAAIIIDMLTIDQTRRPSIVDITERWYNVMVPHRGTVQVPNDMWPIESSTSHPPRMLGRPSPRMLRSIRRQNRIEHAAVSLKSIDEEVNGVSKVRETGKMMRTGGGAFSAINRPLQSPNRRWHEPTLTIPPYPSLSTKFNEAGGRAQYIGYKIPTLRPLQEADEDVVRVLGTGVKRTWEDRESEDAGPEGKAAKLG